MNLDQAPTSDVLRFRVKKTGYRIQLNHNNQKTNYKQITMIQILNYKQLTFDLNRYSVLDTCSLLENGLVINDMKRHHL